MLKWRWWPVLALATLAAGSVFPSARAVEKTPVILISIDTLRADHLSAYGYTKIRTPNIDAFGEAGTTFDRMQAPMPFTLPSHTVMMTSTNPYENQVRNNSLVVPRGAVTLASVLRANGYRTAAFVGSMILQADTGLDQGFDVYDAPFALRPGQSPGASFAGLRRDAAAVTKAARAWLDRNRSAPVFAFLHFYDLHAPYTPPIATGAEPAIGPYDLELAYVDQVLGRFKAALQSNGLWDKSLVIVTADHGESLGDHGEPGHGYAIYNSTMHVPFIVHWPGGKSYPRRVSEPAGLIDLAPTVLDVLRVKVPPAFKGVSLLATRERTIYGESPFAKGVGNEPLRSLVSGPYKYIDAPTAEMYDLVKDPRELVNLLPARARDASPLKARLAALTAAYPSTNDRNVSPPVSDSRREMLRSLGYIGGGPPKSGSRVTDPRELLKIAEALETAQTMVAVKQYGQAVMLLKQVLTWDSQNAQARRAIGEACKFVPTLPDCKGR